jgi:alpha-galactosidase
MTLPGRTYYDNTKTTATILKNLYKTIQDGAGDADVIGCNVYGHLSAGIHSMQRVGGDTSGKAFEITRSQGINSMLRLPINNKFYLIDPDCAAFTKKVDFETNLNFLEMCALTDCTTIASVTPGIFTESQLKQINQVYKLADKGNNGYVIKNFDKTNCPDTIISVDKKQEKSYNWYKYYDGIRSIVSWDEPID